MTPDPPDRPRPPDGASRSRLVAALVALGGLLVLLVVVTLAQPGTRAPSASPAPSGGGQSPGAPGSPAPETPPASTPLPSGPPNLLGVDIAALPTEGPAWDNVVRWADEKIRSPSLKDQNDPDNVRTLAAALVYARTGDESYRDRVVTALEDVRGTEKGRTLALARELGAYVIAANLIGYDDERFRSWLREVIDKRMDDDRSLVEMVHEQGNNWGTHGQATLAAVYAFLGDRAGLDDVAEVVRGFTGDRSAWNGWTYNNPTSWAVGSAPINPPGARIDGHDVSGVIHQDQVRGGKFEWPPPAENYVWEALQGLTLATELLDVQGYPAWTWGHEAAVRTMTWLHDAAHFPAEGDDEWIPYLVNAHEGTHFPTVAPAQPGKGFGFADWLWGDGG